MIRNDAEIRKDVCIDLKCGNDEQGKCEEVGRPAIGLCECNKPHYGKTGKKLKDYNRVKKYNKKEEAIQK